MPKDRLYVFYIGHPAHYYSSVAIANKLSDAGNRIFFLIRPRKMVLELIKDSPFEYSIYTKKDRGNNKFSMIWSIIKREFKLIQIALFKRPYMFIGTDISITHIGKLFKIPAVILNEDDESVVPLLAKFGFKYSTSVLSPVSCKLEKYTHKKIEYGGFHKLLYLSPTEFQNRFKSIEKFIDVDQPYFLLRFSGLSAHHDDGIDGINDRTAKQIIELLEPKGTVYISSERPLSNELEKYRFSFNPSHMHYYLGNAQMLISDSQSMSVEAALLGTPSIRVSSFMGKIGVLEELEHEYKLTFGIKPNDKEGLFKKIENLLKLEDLKATFQERRNNMLTDKIDVLDFFTWYFNNYPESHNTMKKNPEYYKQFKYD